MKPKNRGVKRMGITEEDARKRLVEVSRGTVVKREWSNGRSRPPVESWIRCKKDEKDMKLLLRELWMIDDDKKLDKLEKEGVQVQSRRNSQARRYDSLLVKKKQLEQRLYDLNNVLGALPSLATRNRTYTEIKEVKDELVETKSKLNLK
jgi:hypothetical protein